MKEYRKYLNKHLEYLRARNYSKHTIRKRKHYTVILLPMSSDLQIENFPSTACIKRQ